MIQKMLQLLLRKLAKAGEIRQIVASMAKRRRTSIPRRF